MLVDHASSSRLFLPSTLPLQIRNALNSDKKIFEVSRVVQQLRPISYVVPPRIGFACKRLIRPAALLNPGEIFCPAAIVVVFL